jgi:hypothetical protein
VLRWLALAVFVLAPVTVIVVYAFRDLLWVAVVAQQPGWALASPRGGRWPAASRTGRCRSTPPSRLPGTRT